MLNYSVSRGSNEPDSVLSFLTAKLRWGNNLTQHILKYPWHNNYFFPIFWNSYLRFTFVFSTQDIIFPDWAWHIVGPLYLMLDGVLSIAWNKGNINPAWKSNPKNKKVFFAIKRKYKLKTSHPSLNWLLALLEWILTCLASKQQQDNLIGCDSEMYMSAVTSERESVQTGR